MNEGSIYGRHMIMPMATGGAEGGVMYSSLKTRRRLFQQQQQQHQVQQQMQQEQVVAAEMETDRPKQESFISGLGATKKSKKETEQEQADANWWKSLAIILGAALLVFIVGWVVTAACNANVYKTTISALILNSKSNCSCARSLLFDGGRKKF
jgi:membrane protease subunit (stomatin/prohibitin family)